MYYTTRPLKDKPKTLNDKSYEFLKNMVDIVLENIQLNKHLGFTLTSKVKTNGVIYFY